MIKTSTKCSIQVIQVLVRNIFIFLFFLFLSLFIWLKVGVQIDTLKVSTYNVDGLYIKLGKKLTLKADHISIPRSKSKPSFGRIDEGVERIKYLLTFFEYIELKEIVFQNNTIGVRFQDDLLKITSKDYDISGTIKREDHMLRATVPVLYIKGYDVTLSGKVTYNLNDHSLETQGHFLINGSSGNFSAKKMEEELSFELNSHPFSDLKSIIDKFDLQPVVRSWVVEKVKAQTYELKYLRGKGSIVNGNFDLDMNALEGEVLFSDVSIAFQENLPPVLAPSFVLHYKNYGLYFDLKEPRYQGKDLNGSSVSIVHLDEHDTTLKLDLKMKTPFDATVQELLQSYELNIPVKQTSGTADARFQADIGLKEDDNRFLVDVSFTKGDVWIEKVKLGVERGSLHYANGFITLSDVYLKDSFYEGNANGKIDLDKNRVDLTFDAKELKLGEKGKAFFVLENTKLPLVLKYEKGIEVSVPKLSFNLQHIKNETVITLQDLYKIKPYLTDKNAIENGGYATIKTKDFETFSFDGEMKKVSCIIYEKEDACKVLVPFQGVVTPDDIDFYAFNKRLHYNKKKSRVNLKNLNIDLEKFLKTKPGDKKTEKIVIIGENSNLRYGDYTLVVDSYDVEVKKNGDVKAIGSASGDIIKFSKINDISTIQALRIKDKVLHPLINFQGLQGGRYSLKTSGKLGKEMKGEIIVEGGVMKGFQAYNNTLALINTLPALAVLHEPGYSKEGFHIDNGVSSYRMIDQKKIIFDSIHIKGGSANIAGHGEIDLEKKTINMNLAIQVARELGQVVGHLPIVGYILMGEDKSMTVGLRISGSLDAPVVQTTAAQDIMSLPLQILKRTLESPIKILTPQAPVNPDTPQ